MKAKVVGILTLGLLAGPMAANAGLIGSNVNVTFFFPDVSSVFCDSGNQTVSAAVEYPSGCLGFSDVGIDVADNGFSVSHSNDAGFTNAAFNGFRLSTLSGPSISSVSYLGGTMGVASYFLQAGSVWVNFAGQGSGRANFGLAVASAVSEPGTFALLGLGLLGIGLTRRSRAA